MAESEAVEYCPTCGGGPHDYEGCLSQMQDPPKPEFNGEPQQGDALVRRTASLIVGAVMASHALVIRKNAAEGAPVPKKLIYADLAIDAIETLVRDEVAARDGEMLAELMAAVNVPSDDDATPAELWDRSLNVARYGR